MHEHKVRPRRYFPSIDYLRNSFQDRILFLTFVVARGAGVDVVKKAFPKVRVITGAIDDNLSERWLAPHGEALEGAIGRKLWVIDPGLGSISGSCILCRASLPLTHHEPMCE